MSTVPPPADPAPAVVLWHRAGSRGKWREIGRATTEAAALALIESSGKRGGDWITRAVGDDPNAR